MLFVGLQSHLGHTIGTLYQKQWESEQRNILPQVLGSLRVLVSPSNQMDLSSLSGCTQTESMLCSVYPLGRRQQDSRQNRVPCTYLDTSFRAK